MVLLGLKLPFFGTKRFKSLAELVRHHADAIKNSRMMGNSKITTEGKSTPILVLDDNYYNYLLKPTITFTPDDSSLDTLELECYRHLGFRETNSGRDILGMAGFALSPEFRDAHLKLLFSEIAIQYKHLMDIFAGSSVSEKPSGIDVSEALSVIQRTSHGITPVYDVKYALVSAPSWADRQQSSQRYSSQPFTPPSDMQPYTEIMVRNGGQVLNFNTVQEYFSYLHQNLPPEGETATHKTSNLESASVWWEDGNKQYFGVEFGADIALEGKPQMHLKRREAIGFFEIQEPYDARLSDTVLLARFEELAHQYANLMVYDFWIQICNMLRMNPNITTAFQITNGPPLNDTRNPIRQSLQRNSGLYTPTIGFYNISIPRHPRYQQNRN